MTKLKIETGADNPVLRQKSIKIDKIDRSIKKLAKDMLQTMNEKNGLGIAAPQVGVNKRMFITTINEGKENQVLITMVNPEILELSEATETGEEGCLSIPGVYKPVERPRGAKVKYTDLKGNHHVLEFEGLNARVIQHENDHLDGILFIDKVLE